MGLLDEMKLVRKVKAVAQDVVDENKGSEPMWATVRSVNETTGKPTVEMDGGELVECASWANECRVGDRVMVEVRNHQVIQTSNATNKAIGKARLDVLEDRIETEVADVEEGLRSAITETAGSIMTEVEQTYLSQDDAEDTYTDKTTFQQTAADLTARIDKAIVSTVQLWYAKSGSAAPDRPTSEVTESRSVYNLWTLSVPAYSPSAPRYYYCYQYELADGTFDWSSVTFDDLTTEAAATAASAKETADGNVESSAQVWYISDSTSLPSKPQSHVTSSADSHSGWRTTPPTYDENHPYYYYCWEYLYADGTYDWSPVIYDRATSEAQDLAATLSTMVREYSAGVLVCKTGQSIGALTNANGSFDVVNVTWSSGTPSGSSKLSSFDSNSVDFYLGKSNPVAQIAAGTNGGSITLGEGQQAYLTGGVPSNNSNGAVLLMGSNGTSDVSQTRIEAKRSGNYITSKYTCESASASDIYLYTLANINSTDYPITALYYNKVNVYQPVGLTSTLRVSGATTLDADLYVTGNIVFTGGISSHNHSMSELTGTLGIGKGGTGATDKATARSNLGIFPDVRTGGTDFGSDKSVTSDNTWTRIGYTTFPAGTWLIITRFTFKPSTTTDGSERWCAGYVGELVETNSNVNVLESGYANNTSNYVVFTVISLRTYSSSTTVYAHAKKKGSNQKVTATYRAIRLY